MYIDVETNTVIGIIIGICYSIGIVSLMWKLVLVLINWYKCIVLD